MPAVDKMVPETPIVSTVASTIATTIVATGAATRAATLAATVAGTGAATGAATRAASGAALEFAPVEAATLPPASMPASASVNNTTPVKLPPAKKARGSPKKKKKTRIPNKQDKKGKHVVTLTVQAFQEPFAFEAFSYTCAENVDAYTFGCKKYLDGNFNELISADLDNANFVKYVYRRVPRSNNDRATSQGTKFWRCLMIRYPKEEETNATTRQQGLEALSAFLRDSRFTQYPPTEILLNDATDETAFPALDEFFLDSDIKDFVIEDVQAELRTPTFFNEWTDFARSIWAGPYYSDFARSLGYPLS